MTPSKCDPSLGRGILDEGQGELEMASYKFPNLE